MVNCGQRDRETKCIFRTIRRSSNLYKAQCRFCVGIGTLVTRKPHLHANERNGASDYRVEVAQISWVESQIGLCSEFWALEENFHGANLPFLGDCFYDP